MQLVQLPGGYLRRWVKNQYHSQKLLFRSFGTGSRRSNRRGRSEQLVQSHKIFRQSSTASTMPIFTKPGSRWWQQGTAKNATIDSKTCAGESGISLAKRSSYKTIEFNRLRCIWGERNAMVFRGTTFNFDRLRCFFVVHLREWVKLLRERDRTEIEWEDARQLARSQLDREQGRKDASEDLSELSEGEKEKSFVDSPRATLLRINSDAKIWSQVSEDAKSKKLYIVLISSHGLVGG